MAESPGRVEVRDAPERSRFEADTVEGVAFLDYRRRDGELHLTHTDVPRAAAGHGIGSRLVRHAAEKAREEGLRIVATCPFARAYLERHPDLLDGSGGAGSG